MTTIRFAVPLVLAAAIVGVLQASRPGATPSPEAPIARSGGEPVVASGQDTQEDVGLTVYNGGLALVRDVRRIQLPRGTVHLRFEDIAATVNPATVHLRSTSQPGRLPVLEQNYEYDLLDPQKLLHEVRRARGDAGAHDDGRRPVEDHRGESNAARAEQRPGVARGQRDRHRHERRPLSLPEPCPTRSTAARRWCGRSTTRAMPATGSRRRISRATSAGVPTTC